MTIDSGGWLSRGLTAITNNTGQPERVLTLEEWREIRSD